jgi:sugar-specific transcriptional regulator TrmB
LDDSFNFKGLKKEERFLNEDDVKTLELAGLGLNQSKVYLALLTIGQSSISNVAKATGIGSANTCRIMLTLEKLALIKKRISVPKLYEAVPLCDAIEMLLKKKMDEIKQIEYATKKLFDKFKYNEPKKLISNDNDFFMIPEKKAYVKLSLGCWQNAEHTVEIVCSMKRAMQAASCYDPEIKKALKRGVTIRTILNTNGKSEKNNSSHIAKKKEWGSLFVNPNWKERIVMNASVMGAIFDQKVATFIIDPESNFPESSCLVTNHKGFISMFHNYCETLWNLGTDTNGENYSVAREA